MVNFTFNGINYSARLKENGYPEVLAQDAAGNWNPTYSIAVLCRAVDVIAAAKKQEA